MAHDREPGSSEQAETIPQDHQAARLEQARPREHWLFRPCDACGATYRVWGTQVELLPCCGGTKCKRDRERSEVVSICAWAVGTVAWRWQPLRRPTTRLLEFP
jgi:hypothetical protein